MGVNVKAVERCERVDEKIKVSIDRNLAAQVQHVRSELSLFFCCALAPFSVQFQNVTKTEKMQTF